MKNLLKMLLLFTVVSCFALSLGVPSTPPGQNKDGAGWYEHTVTHNQKYFKSHPGEPSQWVFIGEETPCCLGDQTAELTLVGQGSKTDHDFSSTKWWGNWNDEAYAEATGFGGFEMDLYANADGGSLEIVDFEWHCGRWGCFPKPVFDYVPNPADVEGEGYAKGKTKTWSYAKDYGLTSKAGAGAIAGGKVHVTGEAFGVDGCPEWVQATLWIGGDVYQRNEAGETGYPNGQFVDGGNESWAGGLVQETFSDNGQSYNLLGLEFGGADLHAYLKDYDGVMTKGSTYVTIDPYGNYRSFYGETQNFSKVNFGELNLVQSYVGGQGGIAGMINKGGSYAGGQATFSYSGSTYGNGNATIGGSLMPGAVFVSGSAHAVGN